MKSKVTYFMVLAFAALFSGCGNDDDKTNNPAPNANGAVTGNVTPANGASQVFLISGSDTLKTAPTAFGDYAFEAKPGTYQLMAKPFPDHEAPPPLSVTVNAGETTEAPEIQLTRIPIDGLISVTLNGTIMSGTPVFSAVGNGSVSVSNSTDMVYLELPVITSTGTFTNSNSDLNVIVLQSPGGERWETTKTTGTATLTVTSFDSNTLKGNATFSFTAPASGNGATGNKSGILGSLKNTRLAR